MPVTSLIPKSMLTTIDKVVRTPKKGQLLGRQLIKSSSTLHPWDDYYKYQIVNSFGEAKPMADHAEDFPVTDVDATEAGQNIMDFGLGITYSDKELGQARQAGVNLDTQQAEAVNRGFAEADDKLIFNGNTDYGIPGLINTKDGQTTTASKQFSSNDPKALMAELKADRQMITQKVGYENATPVLALPGDAYDALDVPYNDYQPTTLLQLLINRGWFSQIVKVNELDKKQSGLKNNVGLMFVNTPDVVQIKDAMPVSLSGQVKTLTGVKIAYRMRTAGAVVFYPSAFLTIDKV
ncbi:hypothetical protein SAMN04487792_1552 [Lactobacillus bombicola]|uniref:DUF2184 domain-containing protein n=1 Tax=Lactobacillus bombicola TaxID=1505723 RepID=A0A1I1TQ09_9LACO|nr:encapsulin [Lactobacillus bombicola]SFD60609.1 hypothetical protein SAMN04487792_1552 [Lactobacillus bombicola]